MKWRNGIGITFDTHLHLYVYNVVWSYNWHIASLLYEKDLGIWSCSVFLGPVKQIFGEELHRIPPEFDLVQLTGVPKSNHCTNGEKIHTPIQQVLQFQMVVVDLSHLIVS